MSGKLIKLVAVVAACLVSLIICEVAVRAFCQTDVDGNYFFRKRHLRPKRLPLHSLEKKLGLIAERTDRYVTHDPDLGWTIVPHARSVSGYTKNANSVGIRSQPTEYTRVPTAGRLRIAVFGDSYTHGDEVEFEGTCGYQLEQILQRRGVDVEVINFGVPGYGMGQAYLRWKKLGCDFRPHLVIFGFCAENMQRAVNVIRPLYTGTVSIPYSKPRFVLADGSLRVMNVPTIPPKDLVQRLKNFEDSNLWRLEFHYDEADYFNRWYLHSKLFSYALNVLGDSEIDSLTAHRAKRSQIYSTTGEPAQVSFAIIEQFRRDVEATGARFQITHLPWQGDLETLLAGRPLEYADFLAQLDRAFDVVHPEDRMCAAVHSSSIGRYFARRYAHYSAQGHELVAQAIAERVASLIATDPQRNVATGIRGRRWWQACVP